MTTATRPAPTTLLTIAQAQERLGVKRTTLYYLLGAGELPYVQVLGRRKIREADVETYIARNLHNDSGELTAL